MRVPKARPARATTRLPGLGRGGARRILRQSGIAAQDEARGRSEVVEEAIGLRGCVLGERRATGADEKAAAASSAAAGPCVAWLVADHEAAGQIEAVFGGGLEQHARARLAAGEGIHGVPAGVGRIGAEIDAVDRCADGCETRAQCRMNPLELGGIESPGREGGLVRDDDQAVSGAPQRNERIAHSREQDDLVRGGDEPALDDQGPVAIEKDGGGERRSRAAGALGAGFRWSLRGTGRER